VTTTSAFVGSLDARTIEALRTLRAGYPDARIAVIGAGALAFHIEMAWRHTSDIDVLVTIGLADLAAAETVLVGWKRRRPPRWEAPNGLHVDIIPAPKSAVLDRVMAWPDGNVMSLAGIALALADRSHLVPGELDITIAPVPVVALLKMAAYLDRPYERDKDLIDLAHILHEYPPNDDDRFFDDAIFDARLTEDQARGTILARELSAMVAPDDRAVVEAFIALMAPDSPYWSRFVSASPGRDEDRLRARFDAFRATFTDGLR
jgi:predicted nucleotidyltransferase